MDDFVVVLVEVDDYGLLSKLGLVGSVNGNIGSRWASTCFLLHVGVVLWTHLSCVGWSRVNPKQQADHEA